jgi:hypothetical protein
LKFPIPLSCRRGGRSISRSALPRLVQPCIVCRGTPFGTNGGEPEWFAGLLEGGRGTICDEPVKTDDASTPGGLECAETRASRGVVQPRRNARQEKTPPSWTGQVRESDTRSRAPQDRSCHDSAVDGDTSANALVEIDNLAPIHPGIDISDCPASGALEMSADVAPIPIRQFFQWESAAVSANPALGRTHAIYENGTKARVTVDRAFPIPKPWCWFATPGHDP